MSESGRAVRELLAALGVRVDPFALALAELEATARAGGEPAARSVRLLVSTSRRLQAEGHLRAERAERLLAGQATVPDPPAGHEWVTQLDPSTAGPAAGARLVCITCALGQVVTPDGPRRQVLAGECLARARATEPEPATPCSVCGVVHP